MCTLQWAYTNASEYVCVCVYTFELYVLMCVTFSLISGRIFTIFLGIFRSNCCFYLLLLLLFAGIPFSSILMLFIRVFAKSTFFYVSTHKLCIYFEQTPSKHSVWPCQISGRSITILYRYKLIDRCRHETDSSILIANACLLRFYILCTKYNLFKTFFLLFYCFRHFLYILFVY